MRDLAEVDILRDGHFRNQVQLLINDCHSGVQRFGSVAEYARLAVYLQVAGGRNIVAAENFQQRRFSGSIFPHQGVDLSAIAVKANIGERLNAGKGHGNAAK